MDPSGLKAVNPFTEKGWRAQEVQRALMAHDRELGLELHAKVPQAVPSLQLMAAWGTETAYADLPENLQAEVDQSRPWIREDLKKAEEAALLQKYTDAASASAERRETGGNVDVNRPEVQAQLRQSAEQTRVMQRAQAEARGIHAWGVA